MPLWFVIYAVLDEKDSWHLAWRGAGQLSHALAYVFRIVSLQREHFLTPNRGKAELIGWEPRSAVFLPDRSHTWVGQRLGPGHDDGHGAVHDAFMTLPPYARTSEGEVHELSLGVRNCSHRALSDPLSEQSERIERACEATSAEGTARCASRGLLIALLRTLWLFSDKGSEIPLSYERRRTRKNALKPDY
jgi:hypothetical protein